MDDIFDVVGVNIKTMAVRVMDTDKDAPNAEAFIKMAVMRRGVEEEFFVAVDAGAYKDGDTWAGRNPSRARADGEDE